MSRDLSIVQVVQQAYARAIPPNRLVKLLNARLAKPSDGTTTSAPHSEDQLAAALIPPLLGPSPPSLFLSYLSSVLSASLLSPRTALIHILFGITDSTSSNTLGTLAGILLSSSPSPSALEDGGVIPSFLSDPTQPIDLIPDVGTSASASGMQTSTLALLLPLLRVCSSQFRPPNLSSLVGRTISLLSAFPAPSLDVGLAAGQLLPNLPEEIAIPLRTCLSGLMADLTTQDPIPPPVGSGVDIQMDVDVDGNVHIATQNGPGGDSSLPLTQSMAFLFEHARRSSRSDSATNDSQPPSAYMNLVKIRPYLTHDPSMFLSTLLQTVIQSTTNTIFAAVENVEMWAIVVNTLPVLLKWWKGDSDLPFPDDLVGHLRAVLQALQSQLGTYNEAATQTYNALLAQSEAEDDAAGFPPPDGWQLLSLEETLLNSLLHLGLITTDEAKSILPSISGQVPALGESLIHRLSNATISQLPPLAHIIDYAYGASRSVTDELINVIKASRTVAPPENLFVYIASQPRILSALTTHIPPKALLEICVSNLLDGPVDESGRMDDPQGSLTRFGEGVVLVEAIVGHFGMVLPDLLFHARRAISFTHLTPAQKACMNGWVKAIFGSDGIEDEILLATSPQDLCGLTASLIQQAIAATAAGQIDLDTLHSGLSYFSQPLLSWCLGGMIEWLCREIERLGLLSALHLIVLQDLVLANACPDSLLRINSRRLNNLLDPLSGLEPVFESSRFDVLEMRTKLDMLGFVPEPPIIQPTLRQAIQNTGSFEFPSIGWERTLISSLETIANNQIGFNNSIAEEILSLVGVGIGKGTKLIPMIFTLYPKFTESLILSYIPEYFNDPDNRLNLSTNNPILAIMIKDIFTLLSEIDNDQAKFLAGELVDEITQISSVNDQNKRNNKKKQLVRNERGRERAERIREVFREDEELCVKLGILGTF